MKPFRSRCTTSTIRQTLRAIQESDGVGIAGFGGEQRGGDLVGGGVRGGCLSPEDVLATRDFVHGLATQVVVPSMERRILSLNATVISVRKGMKNFVK